MESPADSSIRLESTDEGFAHFDSTFSDPSKQAGIKEIHFEVLLPSTSVKRLKKLQSKAEAAANQAAFTHAIAAFLGRLATWEPRGPGGGVKLTVTTRSRNLARIQELVASGELDQVHNQFGPPIWELRDSYRYIQFTPGAPPLPRVACVSEFDVDRQYRFHPSVLGALSAAFERAETLEWRVSLPGRRLASDRRALRSALADALRTTAFPPTLATFEIHLASRDPENEHLDPGSFGESADDDDAADDLSLAVRRLCQLPTIRTLRLVDNWVLSPAALGPHAGLPALHCPSLEHLHIDCARTTPGGRWMLSGDPDEGVLDDDYCGSEAEEEAPAAFDSVDSDTSDYAPEFAWAKADGAVPGAWFRFRPEPAYAALLRSLADGALRGMPRLRRFVVRVGRNSRAPLDLQYFPHPDDDAAGRRPFWDVSVDKDFDTSWEMPLELRQTLKGPDGSIGLVSNLGSEHTDSVDL